MPERGKVFLMIFISINKLLKGQDRQGFKQKVIFAWYPYDRNI